MGLFSGKDVTTVGTQVSRVIQDSLVPNSLASGVAKNLFGEDDQLIEHVMDELSNSVGLRADRMYRYGRKTYLYGTPKAAIKTSAAGRDAVKAALESMLGMPVEISYYHFGPFNNLHIGWQRLMQDYGYDSSTNELAVLSAVKGTPVYLQDLQVVVSNATLEELANGSMDQWGPAANVGYTPARPYSSGLGVQAKPTPFAVDPAAMADYVRVDYCWQTTEPATVDGVVISRKVLRTESLQIPVTGFDAAKDYHQARYIANGKAGYWTYLPGSGTYSEVDAAFDTHYNTGGSFFPIVYFRYAKVAGNANTTSDWFKQSSKLVDILGMDYDAITTSIHENPDINNVEQAMMTMAVPANTTNELEQRYLFDFFAGIVDEIKPITGALTEDLTIRVAIDSKLGIPHQDSSIIIQDARFKMALSWKAITRRKVTGAIGKPGGHASGYGVSPSSMQVPVIGGETRTWETSTKVHWYQRQLSETLYEEIRIDGLQMKYWIFENYTTTGDEKDEILLIPIDMAITKHYSIPDRENLYSRSLHYVFNSRVVTHLAWYQTGVFAFVLTVAAVIIAFYTMGPEIAALVAEAATTAAAVIAVIEYIAIKVITSVIISLVFRLFVKIAGVKIALIAAVVAALMAGYNIYEAGGSVKDAPWATELLQVSSGLSKAANYQMKTDFNDLLKEKSDFDHYIEEQTKTLEKTEDLLNSSLGLSPLVIFGENPQDFYHRTVHSGNIGMVGIDVIGSYVDLALQLPKINDTLGESPYVI